MVGVPGQRCFIKRSGHERDPPIAGALIDRERRVPGAQARVPALLDVSLRTTEAADQKLAQPGLGARKIFGRIHRSQDVIVRHLSIERVHQTCETVFADQGKYVELLHALWSVPERRRRESFPSRSKTTPNVLGIQ